MGVLVQEPMEVEHVPQRRQGLSKCCCCCSLQAGCIIIGTLTTLRGAYVFFISLLALIFGGREAFGFPIAGVLLCLMLLLGALHLATGVSLIYGADKRRPSFMKSWLFTSYVEFTLIVVVSLIRFILLLVNGIPVGNTLGLLASFAISTGIFLYCIAVVQCFCRDIIGSEKKRYLKEEI